MPKPTLFLTMTLLYFGMVQAAPRYERSEDCPTAIDIVFVLDESGSIYYMDFDLQLKFVNDFIDRFDTSPNVTHVGVTTFSDDAKTHIPLSSHANEAALKQKVTSINQRRGQTMTNDALDHMTQIMQANGRPSVPHVAIVITDGDPDDETATADAAARAREAGITIIAIGVGRHSVGRDVLLSIASSPSFVYRIENYEGLDNILLGLTEATCEITTVPPTTTLPLLISGCRSQATLDIAFALPDLIGATDTGLALDFVSKLTGEFELGSTQVQTAITPRYCYDDEPIYLDQYDRVDRFSTSLLERRNIPGAATTYHLTHMVTDTFTQSKGARKGAIEIGILVVNENSNDEDLVYMVDAAEEIGIHLIVVGVGNRVSDEELNLIASSKSDIFKAASFEDLESVQADIVTRLCEVAMSY